MRKISFVTGELYHIYNRGVDKRLIFMSDADRKRFCANLYYLNDVDFVSENIWRNIQSLASNTLEEKRGKPYVNVVAWCLMSNHFHLLVQQAHDNGVSAFLHKLGTAYTKYFNIRHERSGRLFESSFKARHVDDEIYFTHVSRYIHLNPLELFDKQWEVNGTRDITGAWNFLRNYPWSSIGAYLDFDNTPKLFRHIIKPNILLDIFDARRHTYKIFLEEWIKRGADFSYLSSDNLFKAKL